MKKITYPTSIIIVFLFIGTFFFPLNSGTTFNPGEHDTQFLREDDKNNEISLTPENMDSIIRMNQIQVVGTHNSYHLAPDPQLYRRMRFFSKEIDAWQYSHLPLEEQLESQHIRQLELDIFPDPQGGIFSDRVGNLLIGKDRFTETPQLMKPGFKVLHVPFVDFETNCYTFVEALESIRDWSLNNPKHLPVMILVEVKEGIPLEYVGWPLRTLIRAGKFILKLTGSPLSMPLFPQSEDLYSVEEEILSVFEKSHLILPDDIRGSYETLNEAVLKEGWPTLKESRGKVIFALDNEGELRQLYLEGNPSLEERLMFTSSFPHEPSAAFIKINDPRGENEEMIRNYVKSGYIVRTRSDSDLKEAVDGDTGRRESALKSGAQYISTDFPAPVPDYQQIQSTPHYQVTLPDAENFPARCNPVNGTPECSPEILQNLE